METGKAALSLRKAKRNPTGKERTGSRRKKTSFIAKGPGRRRPTGKKRTTFENS